MTARHPKEIDKHIGQKLRQFRLTAKMSQAELGDALGLTYQQIQKYEKAQNRVSAGNLYLLSKALQISIEAFFHGYSP